MAAWVRDSLVPCECFVSAQSRVSVRVWGCAPARSFVSHLNEEALQDTNGDEDDEASDEEEAGAEDQLHVQTEQHHRLATEPAAEGSDITQCLAPRSHSHGLAKKHFLKVYEMVT